MKTPLTPLYRLAQAFLLVAALAGCTRSHYRIALTADEAIRKGEPVHLDSRPVGRVADIISDAVARYADIVITDRAALNSFRLGIERERAGSMCLTSASVDRNAPLLPPGSVIPTRAPLANLAKTSLQTLEDWWAAGADYATAHPIAAITVGCIAAALLIGVARAAFARGSLLILLLIGLTLAVTSLPAAVKRAEVEHGLQTAESQMDRAGREATAARQFAAAQLAREAQESGARALFASDCAVPLVAVIREKIGRLNFFTSAEALEDFKHRCTRLDQQREQIADQMAALGAGINGSDRLIKLYVQQRSRILTEMQRDGAPDPAVVIARLAELARYPAKLVDEALLVHWENVTLCRLENGRVVLPDGSTITLGPSETAAAPDADRLSQVEKTAAQLRVDLDEMQTRNIATTSAQLAPASPPPTPATQPKDTAYEIEQPKKAESPNATSSEPGLPRTLAAPTPAPVDQQTETQIAPASIDSTSGSTELRSPPAPDVTVRQSETKASEPARPGAAGLPGWLKDHRIAALVGALGVLLVVALVTVFARRNSLEPHTVSLADQHGGTTDYELAPDEVLLLGPTPYVTAALTGAQTLPGIIITPDGPALQPGTEVQTKIGGQNLIGDHRLSPGEHISVATPGRPVEFEFLAGDPLAVADRS